MNQCLFKVVDFGFVWLLMMVMALPGEFTKQMPDTLQHRDSS
jgi:hypothetical protein